MKWKLTPNGIRMAKKSLMENMLNVEKDDPRQSKGQDNGFYTSGSFLGDTSALPRKEHAEGDFLHEKLSEAIEQDQIKQDQLNPEGAEEKNQHMSGGENIGQRNPGKARLSQVDSEKIRGVEKQLKDAINVAKERSAKNRPLSTDGPQQVKVQYTKHVSPSRTKETIDPKIVLLLTPDSIEAECFKLFRTLLFSPSLGNLPRSILFTSDSSGGILMVECDLRKPKLHDLFGIGRVLGISDYFSKDALIHEELYEIANEQLYVMPGGGVPKHPTGMLYSLEMQRLVDELTASNDDRTVIFDSAPSACGAGGSKRLGYIDGALMVIDYGFIPYERVSGMLELIGRDKILGRIMNKTDSKATFRGSNYIYGR